MRRAASTVIGLQVLVCAGGGLVCLWLGAAARRVRFVPRAVHPAADAIAGGGRQGDPAVVASLAELAYELLDAHADTAQLAEGLSCDRSWAAHLDYLRALQRAGRAMLARAAVDERAFCSSVGWGWLDVC